MINWRKIRTTTKSGERASAVKPHITISFVKRIRCIHTHMEIVRILDISISNQHASDDALTTARKYVLCEMCAFRTNSKQRSVVRKMYRCVCMPHECHARLSKTASDYSSAKLASQSLMGMLTDYSVHSLNCALRGNFVWLTLCEFALWKWLAFSLSRWYIE